MSDIIDYKIHWDDIQFVQIILDPGETVLAEVGTMFFKDVDIEMQTSAEWWFLKWLWRMVMGESFFITSFSNTNLQKRKQVSFAAPYMWKVIALELSDFWWEFICQKDSFMCAAKWIEIEVAFTKKMWAWFFGWEWFILQRLKWDWLWFIHAWGSVVKMELKPGQKIEVDTWCIVWFDKNVDYDIKFIWWFKNTLFGWEGLFLATLEWPGIVYLQSLPFSRIADRIISASWSLWKKWENWLWGLWDLASFIK